MGARVASRVRVQIVRVLFHTARLPGALVSRSARAIRTSDHQERRDAGVFPRRAPLARRPARVAEARPARLRLPHHARSRLRSRHLVRAGRHQLRPGTGRPRPHSRAGGRARSARPPGTALDRDDVPGEQRGAAGHGAAQALRPRGGELRDADLLEGVARERARRAPASEAAAATPARAALLSFGQTMIPKAAVLDRMDQLRDRLETVNAKVVRGGARIREVWDRAWRMLRMRRLAVEEGDSLVVLPRGRPLLEFYANSIAHLLPIRGPRVPFHKTHDTDPNLPALRRDKPR